MGAPIRVVSVMEAASVTGPAKNLLEFARAARPEVELSVITYVRWPRENAFLAACRGAGIAVDLIHEKRAFDFGAIAQFRRHIEARRPAIVQTHNVKSHLFLRWSGLWRDFPWIAFHHGYTAEDFKMRCYNRLNRWSLRKPRMVVSVCAAFVPELARDGVPKDRIVVRHNSVRDFTPAAPDEIRAARDSLRIAPDAAILLCAGRLSREKGHADLLDAIAALRDRKIHLVIAGDGPERARLEARRAALGLESAVTLAGFQPDMRPWYGAADIVALPSHSEGSPNALLEAMSAGLPIAATRAGGAPEIAEDEVSALLVPPREPAALARAIARLLDDPDLRRRLACAARETARRYSPDAYRDAMIGLYRRILDEAPVRP
jgi:glycosyltransferase involved in cell wall biosynthesis